MYASIIVVNIHILDASKIKREEPRKADGRPGRWHDVPGLKQISVTNPGEKAPPLFGRQTMSVYPFRMSSEIRTYYTKVYLSASIPKDE